LDFLCSAICICTTQQHWRHFRIMTESEKHQIFLYNFY
jgi:hypothetical protein